MCHFCFSVCWMFTLRRTLLQYLICLPFFDFCVCMLRTNIQSSCSHTFLMHFGWQNRGAKTIHWKDKPNNSFMNFRETISYCLVSKCLFDSFYRISGSVSDDRSISIFPLILGSKVYQIHYLFLEKDVFTKCCLQSSISLKILVH